ncbi:MAG TPA: LysE family translocator [Acidimicrobiales bacterium]|jgi:threonine/homoserine/homoserine lactone efflux protein|nr:LysE family translocator [Acidimicrobiales bacterium]
MVPLHTYLEFAALAAVVIAVPGPSVMFTVSRALTYGRKAALLTVVGNELGLLIQVVAVAFGLGAIVERSAQVFTVVKLLGAFYLVYLGVQAVRHRRQLSEAVAGRVAPITPRRALRDGAIVGASNPKSIGFFVVALPEFTNRASGHVVPQFLLLGLLFPLIALLLDSIWALAAGAASEWLAQSPRRLAAIGGVGGVVMIGLGLTVAATGRKD